MTAREARDLKAGDLIDLEDDEYASKADAGLSMIDLQAHESTVDTFKYEYAEVESVVTESPECVVVHTSLTSFACPPDHPFKFVEGLVGEAER